MFVWCVQHGSYLLLWTRLGEYVLDMAVVNSTESSVPVCVHRILCCPHNPGFGRDYGWGNF